ncbi:4-(cytidine 5'-diphospho)-2-C-methyl-D-erythritol kinase [Cutibacterium equinum]|uniref:4-diphosphocytidyl-2-C-methyl-D-erythritol kinase n=1 Tax=Cutibacterium equinum TaxID=3016342 RepID=A0ABY7QZG7_9ACTN|nr:4-(cytidine 5'-diphospho)-2-C-methyl-D-erythritol kinase [Cutibacterium equinum]WCC80386.1 4-(cytidine 5'-diphospho)-2-C-methyl-D-erythritol kinase [Cutibacterium equinum]
MMMDDPFDLLRPTTVTVRVSAKVNLALGVGTLAPDGFHPLATVFEAIGIYDDVTVTRRADKRITLTVSGEDADQVPTDETNLAWRAVEMVREGFALDWGESDHGVDIHIDKSIPVAGGMAGGSADAAGALLAAATLCRLPDSPESLQPLAEELGSDVPFCLMGGVALGQGRGDQLAPVICRGRHRWVIATSNQGLSTPAVYRRFDEMGGSPGADAVPNDLISALTRGDLDAVAATMSNDLQAPAVDLRPELGEVLAVGKEAGALTGLVSGSGPTCAFLVRDAAGAKKVSAALSALPQVNRTRTARGPAAGAQVLPGPVGSFA